MNLWNYLKSKMQHNGWQKIYENEKIISFHELIAFSEMFSQKLKGIRCCAIMCKSEMAAGMALLSCFAAGVTALPLSERYGALHCRKILDAISPDAIITDTNGGINVHFFNESLYKEPAIHPALIMCTSGTTGMPKGAMLSESNIIANVSDISLYFNIGIFDTILIARPLYHAAVLTGEFLCALVKGTKIQFYSGEFNPALMRKIISECKITAFCGTPTLMHMMARFKRKGEKSRLKHICISGECMDFETGTFIADAFPKAKIYHVYGLTEACPRVSYLSPRLFRKYADCVGIPLRSVSVKIIMLTGEIAKKNEIGVLWVKGNNVMTGYYNDAEKTKEVMKDGWLCTGDFALINDDGLLKIKGRSDDLIIKAGMNIYPQEIESVLRKDPRVRELYVYGYKDERLNVHIVLNISGDFSDITEVKDMCRALLPSYQIPTRINLMDELNKTCSGKIIRRPQNE